jgi:hypothetical protein
MTFEFHSGLGYLLMIRLLKREARKQGRAY